jgi:hypothetical protein
LIKDILIVISDHTPIHIMSSDTIRIGVYLDTSGKNRGALRIYKVPQYCNIAYLSDYINHGIGCKGHGLKIMLSRLSDYVLNGQQTYYNNIYHYSYTHKYELTDNNHKVIDDNHTLTDDACDQLLNDSFSLIECNIFNGTILIPWYLLDYVPISEPMIDTRGG